MIAVHLAMLAIGAAMHSPGIDEIARLAAGVSNWELGRFDLYKVNPPLPRMLASLPVLGANVVSDYQGFHPDVSGRFEFVVMDDFARANGRRAIWLMTLARWGLLPLAVVCGYSCYKWSSGLYGERAGLLALALWCSCPNLLAFEQVLTSDGGAAALGVSASFWFWRWLRQPTWDRAVVAGIVLGLAELTKTTWVMLFGLWPLLWLVCRFTRKFKQPGLRSASRAAGNDARALLDSDGVGAANRHRSCCELAQLVLMLAFGVFCINAGYGFEKSGTRLRDYLFVSRPLSGAADPGHATEFGNRFSKSWLGALPVPLPRNYLEGIDWQWHDIEVGKPSYLRGRWQERGWWYWYLYALAVKVPLGTWGLFLLAVGVRVVAWSRHRRHHAPRDGFHHAERDDYGGVSHRPTWRDELVLLAPAVAVLVLVSSQTGFSRYLRYVLPAFPFVFIWISGVVATWAWPGGATRRAGEEATGRQGDECCKGVRGLRRRCKRNWRGVVVCALLGWSIGSSLWYAPHWMSYFNELAGGPVGGPKHLIDAQVDWGQDLLYLKKWFDKNPEARPLGLVYFGPIDPHLAGIEFELPPRAVNVSEDRAAVAEIPPDLQPGWYAISVNFLYGYPHFPRDGRGNHMFLDRAYYSYFRRFEPVAMAGYSIYIYHLTAADLEGVRGQGSEARGQGD